MPVRLGGMGIQNPTLTAEREFRTSVMVTRGLTELIENQEKDLRKYDADEMKATMNKLKTEKEEHMVEELAQILSLITDDNKRRNLELAGEKGAGAWLTALPLQAMGYTLNKQEFKRRSMSSVWVEDPEHTLILWVRQEKLVRPYSELQVGRVCHDETQQHP